MDILDFIKSRRSIRKFLDKPVEKELISQILEAARWAPSAGNCQPWRFLAVTDKKKTQKFDPFFHQPWVLNAPANFQALWPQQYLVYSGLRGRLPEYASNGAWPWFRRCLGRGVFQRGGERYS